jgi:hypothetical protein
MEVMIQKKNIVLDATVMNTILSCGRLADFRFNHNFQSIRGKSNSLECGTMFHKIKEVYNKHKIKGFDRNMAIAQGLIAGELYANGCPHCADFIEPKHDSLYTVIEADGYGNHVCGPNCILKPACGHQPQEYPGVKNTPIDSEGHYIGWKYVLQTAIEYFEHYKNDPWIVLKSEIVKAEVLYEDEDIRVMWKAKFDEIVDTNNGIYPCDIKTQKQRREKLVLNNQFIGQCMLMKTRNMIVDNVGFQKSLSAKDKFTRELMSYSSDLLLEWQSETMPHAAYKLLEWSEANYWPPNYTHCENKYGNCPFVKVCESDRNMRAEEIKLNFYRGPKWNPTNDNDGE